MKKFTFYFALLMLISFTANSQITINQNDMPTIGTITTEAHDSICTNVSFGNAGINQTWNLTTIANHYQKSSSWVNPVTLPNASLFPTANLAMTSPNSQNSYIKLSSTALVSLGAEGNSEPTFTITPPFKYFQFPSNYQTAFNDVYNIEMLMAYPQPPIDSLKIIIAVNYSSNIDGWGNVSTPAFSNVPSLRQKNIQTAVINSYMHFSGNWMPSGVPQYDTTINYIWLSNLKKYTLATIQTDFSGNVTEASYLLSTGTVGIDNNSEISNKIEIYPNPSTGIINIMGITSDAILLIFDTEGRLISNKLLKTNQNSLNISNHRSGIYIYQIFDLHGQSIGKGKFTKIK